MGTAGTTCSSAAERVLGGLLDSHLRERVPHAPHPAITCASQPTPSGWAANGSRPPHRGRIRRRGLPPRAGSRRGEERSELLSAALQRLGPSHLRLWASTCSQARWWERSPQSPAVSPALSPSPAPTQLHSTAKPFSSKSFAEAAVALRCPAPQHGFAPSVKRPSPS